MPIISGVEITYTKIRALDSAHTICFQPISALEVHGPHLPLGMDIYMARWMAEESGRRFAEAHPEWTVVQMPVLPVGADELPLAGSMELSPWTLYRAVYSYARSLVRAGFRYIVVTNGHGGPRHAAALEYVCHKVSRKFGVHMITPSVLALHRIITGERMEIVEQMLGRQLSDTEKTGFLNGEHAGSWETSFMLAQNPELVEPSYKQLPLDAPPPWKPFAKVGAQVADFLDARGRNTVKLREAIDSLAGGLGWLLNARYGYGGASVTYAGDPSVASAEMGTIFRELMVRECLSIVEGVTAGRMSALEVRSIASDHAIVRPNFLPGLAVAAAVLLALSVW